MTKTSKQISITIKKLDQLWPSVKTAGKRFVKIVGIITHRLKKLTKNTTVEIKTR